MVRDLMTAARIESLVGRAGGSLRRVDEPSELPPVADVDLVVVDWADRSAEWATALARWRDQGAGPQPRIVVFGPHTDLDAHHAARVAGLGPMKARSALYADLPRLVAEARS